MNEEKTKEELKEKIEDRMNEMIEEKKGKLSLLQKHGFPRKIKEIKKAPISRDVLAMSEQRYLERDLNLELKPIWMDYRKSDVWAYLFEVKEYKRPKKPETILRRVDRKQEEGVIDERAEFEVVIKDDKWYLEEVRPFTPTPRIKEAEKVE